MYLNIYTKEQVLDDWGSRTRWLNSSGILSRHFDLPLGGVHNYDEAGGVGPPNTRLERTNQSVNAFIY